MLKEHFVIADQFGEPFTVPNDSFVEILNLSGIWPDFHATIDSPRWMMRDGLLAVSLWVKNQRIFSISFCFGIHNGRLTAFIGGAQGINTPDGGLLYKSLTKASFGLRPRDLLFEVFRIMMSAVGVERIMAISDSARHHQSRYSKFWVGRDPVKGRYDELWSDRGGQRGWDGFFVIPTEQTKREVGQIPARKRAMYRSRYQMLDRIHSAVAETLAAPHPALRHPNLGAVFLKDATGRLIDHIA